MNGYQRTIARTLGSAALACGLLLLAPGAAQATVVQTPVGQLTVVWNGFCDDFGAQVEVAVSGGAASATHVVTVPHMVFGAPVPLTTNAAGAGAVSLHNVQPDTGMYIGTATVTVTRNGQSGAASVWINCPSNKGD